MFASSFSSLDNIGECDCLRVVILETTNALFRSLNNREISADLKSVILDKPLDKVN